MNGYVADILTSKNTSPEVKKEIVKYLTSQKAPEPIPVSVKTVRSCCSMSVKIQKI
jgi:hypothetical protein